MNILNSTCLGAAVFAGLAAATVVSAGEIIQLYSERQPLPYEDIYICGNIDLGTQNLYDILTEIAPANYNITIGHEQYPEPPDEAHTTFLFIGSVSHAEYSEESLLSCGSRYDDFFEARKSIDRTIELSKSNTIFGSEVSMFECQPMNEIRNGRNFNIAVYVDTLDVDRCVELLADSVFPQVNDNLIEEIIELD